MSTSSSIHRVSGIALGPGDTTTGMSGVKKYWTVEALRKSAESLAGKNVVKNHLNQDVDAVVGSVTEAWFEPGKGVLFKGELDDEELATKIERGRLDVSPRIIHQHVDELEENDDGALVIDEIKEFVNLSIVPQGASKSNKIQAGTDTSNLSQFIQLDDVQGSPEIAMLGEGEEAIDLTEIDFLPSIR